MGIPLAPAFNTTNALTSFLTLNSASARALVPMPLRTANISTMLWVASGICVCPRRSFSPFHIFLPFWPTAANYDAGTFESCLGDDDLPMGVYGTSTWFQGVSPTPPAHPAASSSNCKTVPTVSVAPAPAKRELRMERRFPMAEPTAI